MFKNIKIDLENESEFSLPIISSLQRQTVPELPLCHICNNKTKRHDCRFRDIICVKFVIDCFILKKEKTKIVRIKCVSCAVSKSIYPEGLLPYKRTYVEVMVLLSWIYIFDIKLSTRKKPTYRELPFYNQYEKDEELMPSTFFNWVHYSVSVTKEYFVAAIKSYPQFIGHKEKTNVASHKSHSESKLILLETFCKFTKGVKKLSK